MSASTDFLMAAVVTRERIKTLMAQAEGIKAEELTRLTAVLDAFCAFHRELEVDWAEDGAS